MASQDSQSTNLNNLDCDTMIEVAFNNLTNECLDVVEWAEQVLVFLATREIPTYWDEVIEKVTDATWDTFFLSKSKSYFPNTQSFINTLVSNRQRKVDKWNWVSPKAWLNMYSIPCKKILASLKLVEKKKGHISSIILSKK